MSLSPSGNTMKGALELVSARSRRLFLPPEWKKVIRLAAWQAGMMFIDTWLPMRWDAKYAIAAGYRGKGGRDGIPYYEKGRWIFNAQKAAPRVSVQGDRLRLRIPVPIGHGLNAETARSFRRVTDVERHSVAATFIKAVEDIVNRGSSQRRTFGHTMMTNTRKKGPLMRKVAIKGYTRRLNDQDRAMTRMISRGGFRAGHVALDLQARHVELAAQHRQVVKPRLNPAQLKRRHQEWHRTAGGAAGPTYHQDVSGQTRSQTYAGSAMDRHARAQARYRAKMRSNRTAMRSAEGAANAFISSSI